MRRLYIHKGSGHYIGSHAAVIAWDEEEAKAILRPALDSSGLRDEEISFTAYDLDESQICDFAGGDY